MRHGESDDAARRRVAVVAVHGMGQQREAETLLEWAEPLVRRLEWLADEESGAPGRTAVFAGVNLQGGDDDEVRVTVDHPHPLELRVTEARWSEAFIGMSRTEMFTWGAGFVWRALVRLAGHFSRTMVLVAHWRITAFFGLFGARAEQPAPLPVRAFGWIAWLVMMVLSATVTAIMWAGLVVVGAILSILLPVLGLLLFVPLFSSLLTSIVDTLVEFVGDVGTWTRRPVRAAAMRFVVRERIAAARQWVDGGPVEGSQLIVVAHSQGAAIAAQTLFDPDNGEPVERVDAFVSVGAAVTLFGSSRWSSASGVRAWALRALSGVTAGEPTFDPVRAWSEQNPRRSTRWLNFWGIWDPFSAGPISTASRLPADNPQRFSASAARRARWSLSYRFRAQQREPLTIAAATDFRADGRPGAIVEHARGPREHPVHNTASPLTDHQSYSQNIVQVIDPLARLVLGTTLPLEAPVDPATDYARERRRNALHVRAVRELGFNRLVIVLLAAVLTLAPLTPEQTAWIVDRALSLFQLSEGWLYDIVTSWGRASVVILGIAAGAVGLWINLRLWRYHIAKIAWRRVAPSLWVGGLVLRILLVATALTLILLWAARPLVEASPAAVGAAALGLFALGVLFPYSRVVPLPVEEYRGGR